jgi:hypothetical protein
MPQYVLRDIPVDVWARFKERAERENWPLRALYLQLMDDFGSGRLRPQGAPPEQMPVYAWVRPYYLNLVRHRPFFLEMVPGDQWGTLHDMIRRHGPAGAADTLNAIPGAHRDQVLTWLRDTTKFDAPGPTRLTLRAIAHIGKGPSLTEDRRVFQYEVLGLPPGQQAWIAFFQGEGWRILRVIDGKQGKWEGAYAQADEARGALETFVYLGA